MSELEVVSLSFLDQPKKQEVNMDEEFITPVVVIFYKLVHRYHMHKNIKKVIGVVPPNLNLYIRPYVRDFESKGTFEDLYIVYRVYYYYAPIDEQGNILYSQKKGIKNFD